MKQGDDQVLRRILEELRLAEFPWFPRLTQVLTDDAWEKLLKEAGLSPATYSTTRVLRRASGSQSADGLIQIPTESGHFTGTIELLPDDIQSRFASENYRYPSAGEIEKKGLVESVSRALELIEIVPSLYESANLLIRRVHLLKSKKAGYDVSFSDPNLPFSVFVSIPEKNESNESLRLAEAIVHEAMHLQLTLLDNVFPMAVCTTSTYYSPWKRVERNAVGLLHALYVFTVIDAWLKHLPTWASGYSASRRHEIANQIGEIRSFERAELTEVGRAIRRFLFAQH